MVKSRKFTKKQVKTRMDRESKLEASSRGYMKIQALFLRAGIVI